MSKQIKPYDIVLIKKDKTLLAKLMTYLSKDKYVHCFIVNKDGMAVDLDPRNKPHNLKLKSLDSWKEENMEVYSINRPIKLEEATRIEQFIFLNVKCKYDFVDCILLCLHLPPNRDNHYNCQSFLRNLLKYARFKCNAVTIGDFAKLDFLERKE